MNNKLIIIGSGWLGRPLAKHLNTQGYQVTATTTQAKNCIDTPGELAIVQLDTTNPAKTETTLSSLAPSTMIIAIPPARTNPNYLNSLMVLSQAAKQAKIQRVIFISSSSVWGDNTGRVDETTIPLPTTDSAKAMVRFEQHLQQQTDFLATTLCLTGLFNAQRHPGRFLAGREDVANPDAPVNMIHQQDCIGLITNLLKQASWQNIYIGCAPSHPTRKAFYSYGANQLGLAAPQFQLTGGINAKVIDAQATAKALNYDYVFPDIIKALSLPS